MTSAKNLKITLTITLPVLLLTGKIPNTVIGEVHQTSQTILNNSLKTIRILTRIG